MKKPVIFSKSKMTGHIGLINIPLMVVGIFDTNCDIKSLILSIDLVSLKDHEVVL